MFAVTSFVHVLVTGGAVFRPHFRKHEFRFRVKRFLVEFLAAGFMAFYTVYIEVLASEGERSLRMVEGQFIFPLFRTVAVGARLLAELRVKLIGVHVLMAIDAELLVGRFEPEDFCGLRSGRAIDLMALLAGDFQVLPGEAEASFVVVKPRFFWGRPALIIMAFGALLLQKGRGESFRMRALMANRAAVFGEILPEIDAVRPRFGKRVALIAFQSQVLSGNRITGIHVMIEFRCLMPVILAMANHAIFRIS